MNDKSLFELIVEKYGLLLTLETAAKLIGRKSGRSLLQQIENGQCGLQVFKDGGRWMVKTTDLIDYIQSEEDE